MGKKKSINPDAVREKLRQIGRGFMVTNITPIFGQECFNLDRLFDKYPNRVLFVCNSEASSPLFHEPCALHVYRPSGELTYVGRSFSYEELKDPKWKNIVEEFLVHWMDKPDSQKYNSLTVWKNRKGC